MENIELRHVEKWPEKVVIYTDGASRGNPGPASFGLSVQGEDGSLVYESAAVLGDQTNNFAEYTGVIRALEVAMKHGAHHVTIKSDSELMVKQMKGQYKVKSEVIKPLFLQCKKLIPHFKTVLFVHVRRELNKRADELANSALDQN